MPKRRHEAELNIRQVLSDSEASDDEDSAAASERIIDFPGEPVMGEEAENTMLQIDKNTLFFQMMDTFAKDTLVSLKHRPVNDKRTRQSSTEDSEDPPSALTFHQLELIALLLLQQIVLYLIAYIIFS